MTSNNSNKPGFFRKLYFGMATLTGRGVALIWGVVALAVIGVIIWLFGVTSKSEVTVEVSKEIDITPALITLMKEIGEWEFLSIENEELIDTVRKGFFSDDELVRIYYGRLRLGINMHKTEPRWIRAKGDSVSVTLPAIELLDTNFIDEARTQSFFESGSWSDADREALYQRAYRTMKRRCLTPQNIKTAQDNARQQLIQIMKSLGFKHVNVVFAKGEVNSY